MKNENATRFFEEKRAGKSDLLEKKKRKRKRKRKKTMKPLTFARLPTIPAIPAITAMVAIMLAMTGTAAPLEISTPEEYRNFVNSVNSGNNYRSQTVFLNNDLDLEGLGTVDPIGTTVDNPFMGVFDGRGHTISNLKIKTNSYRVGMFGATDNGAKAGGTTVKNVILDSTCVVEGTKKTAVNWVFVSGFIAGCSGHTRKCRIEGCVNMADVKFTGSIKEGTMETRGEGISLGGIVGGCSGVSHPCVVQNCVNYGTVTLQSNSSYTYISGIVGYFVNNGTSSYVNECINYGHLVNTGASIGCLFIAGVVGYASGENYAQNCVNFGTYSKGTGSNEYYTAIGGAVSRAIGSVKVSNCYWRSDVWDSAIGKPEKEATSEKSQGFDKDTLTLGDGTSLYDALKSNSEESTMYKVTLDLNGGSIDSKCTNPLITATLNSIPDPVKGNTVFCGWCTDSGLKDYADFSTINPGELTLYAKWYHTITFVVEGGEAIQPIDSAVGEVVTLPKLSDKCGYAFSGWKSSVNNTIYGEGSQFIMPKCEVAFTAQFSLNEYALSFYNHDGSLIDNSTKVDFGNTVNSSYFPTQNPIREGHTFSGWDMAGDDSELVSQYENSGSFSMSCHDVSFTAQFSLNEYTLFFYNWNGSLIEGNIKVEFNATVNSSYFPTQNVTREGFIFDEWVIDGDDDTLVSQYENSGSFNMPSHDVSFTAQFISDTIQIEFGGSVLEGDVKGILGKYVDDGKYTIVKFDDSRENTVVIIKFDDVQEAKNFVENIGDSGYDVSYKTGFISEAVTSYAFATVPLLLYIF